MSVYEGLDVLLRPGFEKAFLNRIASVADRVPGTSDEWVSKTDRVHFYAGVNDLGGYVLSFNHSWIPLSVVLAIVVHGKRSWPIYNRMIYSVEQDVLFEGVPFQWTWWALKKLWKLYKAGYWPGYEPASRSRKGGDR